MKIKKILNNQQGVTLVLSLLVMASVAILGVAIVTVSQLEVDSSYSNTEMNELFYLAEGRTIALIRQIEMDNTFLYGDLGVELDYADFEADTFTFNVADPAQYAAIDTRAGIYGAGRSAPMAYSDISMGGSTDKPKEWWHFFIVKAAACRASDRIRFAVAGDEASIPQKEINAMVRKTYIY